LTEHFLRASIWLHRFVPGKFKSSKLAAMTRGNAGD
jgi:hypothetical protein